uniref:Uncharacterized protein n=1 Tax=Anguilla anguilla TaxID=7936 RepID=A0A0E9S2J7_ANGAN
MQKLTLLNCINLSKFNGIQYIISQLFVHMP